MKTSKQIRRYIRRQPWYSNFLTFVMMEEEATLHDKLFILLGREGEATVARAFDWGHTVQGYSYWAFVSAEFIRWYRNENIRG